MLKVRLLENQQTNRKFYICGIYGRNFKKHKFVVTSSEENSNCTFSSDFSCCVFVFNIEQENCTQKEKGTSATNEKVKKKTFLTQLEMRKFSQEETRS